MDIPQHDFTRRFELMETRWHPICTDKTERSLHMGLSLSLFFYTGPVCLRHVLGWSQTGFYCVARLSPPWCRRVKRLRPHKREICAIERTASVSKRIWVINAKIGQILQPRNMKNYSKVLRKKDQASIRNNSETWANYICSNIATFI